MKRKTKEPKQFPDGMVPLGNSSFRFSCHPEVSCFNTCCRKLEMYLFPYDIIRLKNRLGLHSETFLRLHTALGRLNHPFFPAVMMKMADNAEQTCPFLSEKGCTVYEDRPSACRTYPLERAVDRTVSGGRPVEYYFMTRHPYCRGHEESTEWRVREWLRDQHLLDYNYMNDLWAEVDTLFASNPWQGEGAAGPRQQMAFMVCYNIDGFRQYVRDNGILQQYRLDRARIRLIDRDDEALLKFGFDWLKFVLGNIPCLQPKR